MTVYAYKVKLPISGEHIEKVQITGNFDDWKILGEDLVKESDGYVGIVKVPEKKKLVFKFVINDEQWVINDKYKVEYDSNGIENNYVDESELSEVQEFDMEEDPERATFSPAVGSPAKSLAAGTDSQLGDSQSSSPDYAKSDSTSDNQFADNRANLTQVLTSGSSFAAVSIPESSTSEFGNLDDSVGSINKGELCTELTQDDLTRDDEHDEQFNTPTNSLINSAMLPSSSSQLHAKNPGSSTADTSYITSSSNLRGNADHPRFLQQLDGRSSIPELECCGNNTSSKIPGGYPDLQSRPQIASTDSRSSGKRENIMSKFKSFFHY